MAEVFVGALSEVLIDKLISIASQKIGRVFGVNDDFKRLQETLSSIQDVLSDAEKKQVEKSGAIKNWLMKLKDVVYDIEDIVDEFEYEALRYKLEIQGRTLKKVRNLFSPTNQLAFRFKMSHKIKHVNQKLDEITKDKERFQFASTDTINCFKRSEGRETSSRVDDPNDVVGRDLEKSKVIDDLILNNNLGNHFVVRIVGIGGVGKTTLARLIYNDKQVQDHFDITFWVCVSNNSTKKAILSNLLESINESRCDLSSLDVMERKIEQALGSKRYLMVLDDVWNDGIDWEDMLKCLLSMGVKGSRIIMTSRSDEDIPSLMVSIYNHRLEVLSEAECWSIFEKIAFGNGGAKKTQELIKIGMEIVKKCGGVPLAAKTLGGMMHSTSNEGEWLSIQQSDIWSLPEGQEKIMRVLKLSYDHLPSQVQRCFSYCSIFLKDHEINKEKLIQLWMAEGFLSPSNKNEALRNVGKKYLNILLRNCFFEDGYRTRRGGKTYKMHDLVHDLALSVIGNEYSMSDGCLINEKEIDRLRHVRVRLVINDGVLTIPQAIYEAKKLRTFICINKRYWFKLNILASVWDRMFLKLNYLRVMDLSCCKMEELPPSIGKLKHLRYIDLSDTNLTRLPDSFTSLYNLQTLIIKDCRKLKELPKDMKKLTNLRHLITDGTEKLRQMPMELGKLSLLERLSYFIVGKDKGYGIEELKDLNLLRGKIEIRSLDNVRNGEGALSANLKEKLNIRELVLKWNDKPDDNNYHEVLEGLQPQQNLKRLSIYDYCAFKFPSWIMSISYHLPNLVSLTLKRCKSIPNLMGLNSLQELYIRECGSPKSLPDSLQCLPALEELSIGPFSKELNSFPFPPIITGSINDQCFVSLRRLEIYGWPGLKSLPDQLQHLVLLQELLIVKFPSLEALPEWLGNLASLRYLWLWNCENLMYLPSKEQMIRLTSLQSLQIKFCPLLKERCWGDEKHKIAHIPNITFR